MAQKQVLGKGLASLFPGISTPPAAAVAGVSVASAGAVTAGPAVSAQSINVGTEIVSRDRHPGISLAAVDEIQVNQYQPRREFDEAALEELAQSIRSNGVIQPLIVRKTAMGAFELIAGERRLRAAKKAGLKQVPVVIRRSTDRESLELALIENIQRQDLNCIDEALAYFQLIQDFNLTQEEVALRVGKERTTVTNHLRLLKLPEAIIDDLKRGILTLGHGKALLGIEDNDQRLLARKQIIENKMSVRDTEALIEQMKNKAGGNASSTGGGVATVTPIQSRLQFVSQELTKKWSVRVELRGTERRGKIIFNYSSRQELDRLIESLQNQNL